jgi:hypothetical protein
VLNPSRCLASARELVKDHALCVVAAVCRKLLFHVFTSDGIAIQLKGAFTIVAGGFIKIDKYAPPANSTEKGERRSALFPPLAVKESGNPLKAGSVKPKGYLRTGGRKSWRGVVFEQLQ